MEKSSQAFRTIGEMAKELNLKTHILRYWEEQFPMLEPLKRAGGRRHYRPEDVALLHRINTLLNEQGYTIKGARKFLLSGDNQDTAAAMSEKSSGHSDMALDGLRTIRDKMEAALKAA